MWKTFDTKSVFSKCIHISVDVAFLIRTLIGAAETFCWNKGKTFQLCAVDFTVAVSSLCKSEHPH